MIEIEIEDGEALVASPRASNGVLQGLDAYGAVGEPRQRVESSHPKDILLGPLAFGNVAQNRDGMPFLAQLHPGYGELDRNFNAILSYRQEFLRRFNCIAAASPGELGQAGNGLVVMGRRRGYSCTLLPIASSTVCPRIRCADRFQ